MTERWKAYAVGPNNTNLCANPELFDRPIQKTIQGKVAPGLNLDGDNGSGSGQADGCSRLSFLLWNTTPGDILLKAAEQGRLDDQAQLAAVAGKMVASPRLEAGVRAFFSDMLLFEIAKDRSSIRASIRTSPTRCRSRCCG